MRMCRGTSKRKYIRGLIANLLDCVECATASNASAIYLPADSIPFSCEECNMIYKEMFLASDRIEAKLKRKGRKRK